MAGDIHLHVVTRREYRLGHRESSWDDPGRLLNDHPAKRQALMENPLAGDDEQPARLVATRDGQVVGKTDFVPGLLTVRGVARRMLWSSSTVVAPHCRRQGIGTRLTEAKRQLADVHGTCGVSVMNQGIYRRLNWREFALSRFILLLRARPVVQRYVSSGTVGLLVTPVAQAGVSTARILLSALKPVRSKHLEARPTPSLAEELDGLLAPRAEVATHRSARWINWQLANAFTGDPRSRQDLYLVYDRAERPLGYFTTKIRFHRQASHRGFPNVLLGSLQHRGCFDPDQLSELQVIDLAAKALRRQGCDAIEVCVRDQQLAGQLRRFGFMPLGQQYLYFTTSDHSDLDLSAFPAEAWDFGAAEGDSFFT